MIVLKPISLNGEPLDLPSVTFDEMGGTVGRAVSSQLVLADPGRAISRTSAEVLYRAGQYILIDRSSNPILHNGVPLGNGKQALLSMGDQIGIGGYQISVLNTSEQRVEDPFAGFDSAPSIAPANMPTHKAPDSLPRPVAAPPTMRNSPASAQTGASSIPDDWDPFASIHAPERSDLSYLSPGPTTGASLTTGSMGSRDLDAFAAPITAAAGEESLDALFGLGGAQSGGDPFIAKPAGHSIPHGIPSDHVSDLQAPWSVEPSPQAQPKKTPQALSGAVFSWDTTDDAGTAPVTLDSLSTFPRMGKQNAALAISKSAEIPPLSVPLREVAIDPTKSDDLQQAFLKGLELPNLPMAPLTAETMYLLGQMLRESTKGTVDLLAARAALKKEVRADLTLMGSSANNAMKFSPSVDFALQYLLGPRTPGFMGPLDSMRDAYSDLKAHQMGVMAGMRAALTEVLQRFNPAQLEKKLEPPTKLAGLLPAGRKAKLWEQFQLLFSQIATEAEDDFDDLFGKAFVREYERCIAQVSKELE
jgi:FHA domain-containing protein